jgi:hypothetical protein
MEKYAMGWIFLYYLLLVATLPFSIFIFGEGFRPGYQGLITLYLLLVIAFVGAPFLEKANFSSNCRNGFMGGLLGIFVSFLLVVTVFKEGHGFVPGAGETFTILLPPSLGSIIGTLLKWNSSQGPPAKPGA